MELEIHEFQMTILRELLFNPGSRFRDLNKVGVTNDHFTFHIKRLMEEGLIIKKEKKYFLTNSGKEFANRMDTDVMKLERQAKLGVALHAVRKAKGVNHYLVHQRLKEPFYGWYGSHTGKIRWGEKPLDAAKREFQEETGMSGKFKLKGIVHYHHYHVDGRFLEDKYFWVYKITALKGKLKVEVPEGKNIWMTTKQYKKLKNVFATYKEKVEVIDSKDLVYVDRTRFVDSY